MKISIISPPPNLSGGERVVAIYASLLGRRGHQVEIVCLRAAPRGLKARAREGLRRLSTAKLPLAANNNNHFDNYEVPYKYTRRPGVLSSDDLADPDIVIATFWRTAAPVAALKQCKISKVYLVQHDEGAVHQNNSSAEATYSLPLHHIYVSDWIRKRITSRHSTSNHIVIPNAAVNPNSNVAQRRKPSTHRIGVMWSTASMKGCDVAVQAIEEARKAIPELLFVGFGTKLPPEREKKLFDEFIVQPSATQLEQLYSSCTAWLFSSRFEGFGLPIYEALTAGTPVIGTETGAAPELLANGEGILIPIDDPIAMSKAIQKICALPAHEWQAMSNRALERANAYTWDDAADALESYLLALLKSTE